MEYPWRGGGSIVQGDDVFTQGYGVLEAGKSEAVNADTIFAIGSTTKAFTSALIGMLVDEGKLVWDDPVVKYLPDFQLYDDWVTKNVTVRDLLCHRLGLERAQRLYYHRGYDQRELMRRMRYLKPTSNFRTQFQYANQQYGVAGLLVEAVTGKSWDDFITERIFNALNMSRSFSGHDRITDHKNFVSPHAVADETYPAGVRFLGEMQPTDQFKIVHEPAGSIHTTANDLAQWLKALLQNGAPLLATQHLQRTHHAADRHARCAQLRTRAARLSSTRHAFLDVRARLVGNGLSRRKSSHARRSNAWLQLRRRIFSAAQTRARRHGQCPSNPRARRAFLRHLRHPARQTRRDWSSEFQMVAQGYMAQVKGQVDEMRLARNPNLPPSIGLDSFAGTFSNDLFGEMTVIVKDDSLNLQYGDNTVTLEHWQGDTFLAHWNLKTFLDDSMIAFSPDGKTMTLLNDRAEYRKLS